MGEIGVFEMKSTISRDQALELLMKYNKESFHIQHGLTVEGTMRWYAKEMGYGEEEDYWGIVGLLHDIDFELYPEEHCVKAPELLREAGVGEDMITSVCSHGYGICCDVEPKHDMEKILFAADELTGLIGAAALMRPSKSVMDMEVSSVKKKFKDKRFAAGCSRDVIRQGVEKLDYVIGTHPDSDHIGGLDVIIYKFQCDTIFMPDFVKDTKTYDDVIQTVKNKNYKITCPNVGDTYNLGEAEFTVIAPNDDYGDANNASIGIYLTYGGTSFLFTGDAEEEAEKGILANGINIDSDVYKAGHHGSRTSSCDELLEKVSPEYVVVSCGEDNSYGHPHAAILNYCISNNIPMYRTDTQGTIVAKSDGKNITWNMSPAEY